MTAPKYLAILAGGMFAAAALAGGDEPSMSSADRKFDQLDANQDQALSRSEAAQDETLSAVFASIDSDGDGQLSRAEYAAHISQGSSSGSRDWSSSSDYSEDQSSPEEYSSDRE